ncbi:hypothetical protein NRB_47000 [Novosphingobium sp. 11B]
MRTSARRIILLDRVDEMLEKIGTAMDIAHGVNPFTGRDRRGSPLVGPAHELSYRVQHLLRCSINCPAPPHNP